MGRGDIKSAKGKRTAGSYGNTRQKKKAIPYVPTEPKKVKEVKEEEPVAEVKPKAAPKAKAKKE